ncbi:FliC/FljB family flagellin [Entomohabitans teleogrylli]|uniref:FliC/FljB family flagellin n=1 Tax=Entomohabitans teleogrylli TaxID=1384589 RepID=UPI00073DAC5E|nr:FliC/FljB family flagellin [Entomohabitans teleogrylli]
MSQVINTNALSLVAQNNLNKSQSALGTSIERLSSGLRINSAKDDAAGQAISNRFTANITGLTQASRNANDGISISQTTEGALNEVNDNLQNIRRLTVQAQNGTNSESDRKSIQDEINARLDEINRISEQTEFNGVKVLSKDQTLGIQVGANDGQTIDINLSKVDSTTLGMSGFDVTTIASKVNAGATIATAGAASSYQLEDADLTSMKETAFGVGGSGDIFQVKDDNGNDVLVAVGKNSSGADVAKVVTATTTQKVDGSSNPIPGEFTVAFTAATDATAAQLSKTSPLDTIDAAMAQVDELRSALGATQNRFDSVISNLNSTVNNLSESRSRILDADFASEVSEMSRANILQSAGISVLAQANQVPQNVLSLLR